MQQRVLLDTNVYVSFMVMGLRASSAVGRLFDMLSHGTASLVLPTPVFDEVIEKVRQKPEITVRIAPSLAVAFLDTMRAIAEPALPDPIGPIAVVRDPDDDVVLAYALAADVDYLITGDKDLLVLADALAPLKIRTPQAFLEELERDRAE